MFDENMSGSVAKALELLDKDVKRARPARRGETAVPDEVVARQARESNRLVFTNNFDMVVAAVSEDTRLIWFFDQKNNSPTKFMTARLFFYKWDRWERMLSPSDTYCLRVSMDRSTLISKNAAFSQASRLDRKQKATRRRVAAYTAQGKLAFD